MLDGLPLPKPIVNGGGFHPTVDEWQNVDVDVPCDLRTVLSMPHDTEVKNE